MIGYSAVEMEALGKKIGLNVRKQIEGLSGAEGKFSDDAIKKVVEKNVREILRESAARGGSYAHPMNPNTVFEITKALDEPAGDSEVKKNLQEWNDNYYLVRAVARGDLLAKNLPFEVKSAGVFQKEFTELAKALNTSTAGAGSEWIPTGFSSQMIEALIMEATVAKQFKSFKMPTNPYTFPLLLGHGTAYKGGEATSGSPSMYRSSNPETDNLTFSAVKLIANYPASDEISEDAVVSILPVLRASIAQAIARAIDDAIVNGDTSTTHLDTGYTVASYDARRCWNGLRDQCISAMKQDWSTTWSTSTGLAFMRALQEDMGKYGIRAKDLCWLINANMYNKIKAQAEVSTVDKFGSAATVVKGELSAIDGVELVLTEHVEEQQNDSGVYDGTTVTDTQALLVWKPGFMLGIRKAIQVEYVRRAEYGINYLVANMRGHWKSLFDVTAERMIGWGYNVTK